MAFQNKQVILILYNIYYIFINIYHPIVCQCMAYIILILRIRGLNLYPIYAAPVVQVTVVS